MAIKPICGARWTVDGGIVTIRNIDGVRSVERQDGTSQLDFLCDAPLDIGQVVVCTPLTAGPVPIGDVVAVPGGLRVRVVAESGVDPVAGAFIVYAGLVPVSIPETLVAPLEGGRSRLLLGDGYPSAEALAERYGELASQGEGEGVTHVPLPPQQPPAAERG